jgi:hypothetical protein
MREAVDPLTPLEGIHFIDPSRDEKRGEERR